MKIFEFESKLSTVSDAKLQRMLSESRARGPEVAVKLILEEVRKRGLSYLEMSSASGEVGYEEVAFPMNAADDADTFGSEAGREAPGIGPASSEEVPAGETPSGEAPAGEAALPGSASVPPDWIAEEMQSGLPVAVKAILFAAVIGCLLALAWKFSQ